LVFEFQYNAMEPGQGGGGGEYRVQTGFGWTNGVVLEFLSIFPDAKFSDEPRDIDR
jgi:alpha,alpha-trehalase